jgi:hypothetical protein
VAAEKCRSRVAGPPIVGQPFLVPLAAANTGWLENFVGLQQRGCAFAGGSPVGDDQIGSIKMIFLMQTMNREATPISNPEAENANI